MPENPIIQEGGSGRRMGSVGRIITFGNGGNDVWVPASERITAPKFISKNGVYLASDEGLFAFSKLTVNVYGGAPGMTEPTTPTGPYGVETPTGATPAEIPAIPGGPGSSISGIDPTDGQKYTATVNPDGTISKVRSPAAIRVHTKPKKLDYKSGESIDYDGLVIELLDAEGNTFKTSDYPDGTIPWSFGPPLPKDESHPYRNYTVVTTMETVPDVSPEDSEATSDIREIKDIMPIPVLSSVVEEDQYTGVRTVSASPAQVITAVSPTLPEDVATHTFRYGIRYIRASKESFGTSYYTSNKYTRDERTVYYDTEIFLANVICMSPHIVGTKDDYDSYIHLIAWTMIYGDMANEVEVPVSWESPYDHVPLTTSFKIKVLPTEGGEAGGGTEGGGTGGGGGHGF